MQRRGHAALFGAAERAALAARFGIAGELCRAGGLGLTLAELIARAGEQGLGSLQLQAQGIDPRLLGGQAAAQHQAHVAQGALANLVSFALHSQLLDRELRVSTNLAPAAPDRPVSQSAPIPADPPPAETNRSDFAVRYRAMDPFVSLGMRPAHLPSRGPAGQTMVSRHGPLQRVLAFTGFSIDDVINDPIARRTVAAYFKLHKQVWRRCQIIDLERWWNPKGRW